MDPFERIGKFPVTGSTNQFDHSFIHSFIHSFTHSLTHSLTSGAYNLFRMPRSSIRQQIITHRGQLRVASPMLNQYIILDNKIWSKSCEGSRKACISLHGTLLHTPPYSFVRACGTLVRCGVLPVLKLGYAAKLRWVQHPCTTQFTQLH